MEASGGTLFVGESVELSGIALPALEPTGQAAFDALPDGERKLAPLGRRRWRADAQ
jgi:hypothetical protein